MSALITSMLSRANSARVVRARSAWLLILAALVAALSVSACDLVGGDEADDDQQQAQEQAEPATAAPAATPAAQPEADEPSGPKPPPESTVTSGAGASAYRIVFPSMALVAVRQGESGAEVEGLLTGLVSADGYVLADLSALDSVATVTVMLSDGTVIADVPVAGADRLTGIAYLGPLERGIVDRLPGATLGDGERMPPGAPVYAVGFTPQSMAGDAPIIISGVFSGLREWTPGQRTFLLTDAFAQEPMLGSVLVDANGVVIGFGTVPTVWRGHYVSTGDLARRLAQESPFDSLASAWSPDPSSAATEHLVVVSAPMMMGELALGEGATGETLTLSVGADVPGVLSLIDAEGKILQQSNLVAGATIVTLRPNTVGPYRLTLAPAPPDEAMEEEASAEAEAMAEDGEAVEEADEAGESEAAEAEEDADMSVELMPAPSSEVSFSVSSNIPLMTLIDQDDLQQLVVGEPLVAGVDAPGDLDRFDLRVLTGEVYEVRAQSLTLDMVLSAMGAGIDAVDDDSGGGFAHNDALLTLAPAEDGLIQLIVGDFGGWTTGAYVLTVIRTVSVEGSNAVMADAEGGESEMVMVQAATLPTPMADLSLRGVITEDGLVPTLQGIGSAITESGALLVPDEDGIFEVVASIIGPNYSTARLFVMDSEGQVVISGRVVANCEAAEPCLASAVYIMPEDAPSPPGEWSVLLQPEGAGSGITEWQIEVHLYAELDFSAPAPTEDDTEAASSDEE